MPMRIGGGVSARASWGSSKPRHATETDNATLVTATTVSFLYEAVSPGVSGLPLAGSRPGRCCELGAAKLFQGGGQVNARLPEFRDAKRVNAGAYRLDRLSFS